MALRPLRNATITFGLVNIPVRFYTATRSEDVHFNLLHQNCGSRVNRRWWCPQHEEFLESGDMVRGYAVGKNQYVTLSDEEMELLESDADRALEITEFVDLDQVDPVFFEKAYYLGPSPGGGKTYRLLAEAMRKQNKVAVARWVMGHREHLVLLRPFEEGLILHTMYYADEVRDFSAIDMEGAELRDKEVALAEMLINELTEERFDPLAYKDTYRERLLDKIRSKSEGEVIVSQAAGPDKAAEVVDIMEALRRSLEGTAKPAAAAKRERAAPKRAPARGAAATTTSTSTSKKKKVS
ncbi:MAG TPA: Ku protein [Thermoanaerobaculia bacterium]|nr:Ku protein [Thermoanaerobaculia bacterium]